MNSFLKYLVGAYVDYTITDYLLRQAYLIINLFIQSKILFIGYSPLYIVVYVVIQALYIVL